MVTVDARATGAGRVRRGHPIGRLVISRLGGGVITLIIVSIVVFAATQILPGNAAYAVLGHNATPARLHALELQLGLNRSAAAQYGAWIGGLLTGKAGNSLANGQPVWALVAPRLVNSAVLVALSGLAGALIGVLLGAIAALRKDSFFDHAFSVVSLALTTQPEFVVAISLVILFATVVFQVLPAVSVLPPGTWAWQQPELLVLPIATLVIVVVPYIFRMMRAAMIEALESEYVEMARLKGLPAWRVLLVHALPNAVPPTVQVVSLIGLVHNVSRWIANRSLDSLLTLATPARPRSPRASVCRPLYSASVAVSSQWKSRVITPVPRSTVSVLEWAGSSLIS